ncbi:unnamed protein product, partial [Trypanosoma congolense IL3000]
MPLITGAVAVGRSLLRRHVVPKRFLGRRPHSSGGNGSSAPGTVRVNATTIEGKDVSFTAPCGMTLMEALRDVARVDIEAACDGTCACSTCHVILRKEDYEKLEAPSEDEMDMLDLAPQVTATSRLACQIKLTE